MVTVFINGRFLSAPLTGVQRVAYQLLEELDASIRESGFLLPHSRPIDFTILHPRGVDVPPYRRIQSRMVGTGRGQLWEQIELPRAAAGGLLLNLCNTGPIAKRRCVTMIHDAQVHTSPQSYSAAFRLWYRFAQPFMGKSHRKILTVSSFSKDELIQFGIAASDRIAVVPNGCDHITRVEPDGTIITRLGLEKRRYVVSSANTQYHKNIGVLLQAFSDVRLSGETLVLFGNAKREDFDALGQKVPPNVVFAGRLSDESVAGLIGGALCLACPSLTEGFGLMPLEAMALGCPAVIAPCGALPEVCTGAALFAGPHAPSEWIEQIDQLRHNPQLWSEMAQLGRRRALQYTWQQSVTTLVGELSRVLSMHPQENVSSHAATHEPI